VSRGDRGSSLMLLPAGVLVVLVLASIAVDMALVQLRQRQAFDVAASAANDAATAGVDQGGIRSGRYVLDPAATRASVARSVATSDLAPELAEPPAVTVTPEAVEVTVTLAADYLFAGVMPGAPDGTTVTASATATAMAP
jgi:Putative Tad-like Flp pilus-assembly